MVVRPHAAECETLIDGVIEHRKIVRFRSLFPIAISIIRKVGRAWFRYCSTTSLPSYPARRGQPPERR